MKARLPQQVHITKILIIFVQLVAKRGLIKNLKSMLKKLKDMDTATITTKIQRMLSDMVKDGKVMIK